MIVLLDPAYARFLHGFIDDNGFVIVLRLVAVTREGEEGEAPAEPVRRQLGRSLALPSLDRYTRFWTGIIVTA